MDKLDKMFSRELKGATKRFNKKNTFKNLCYCCFLKALIDKNYAATHTALSLLLKE